MCGIIGYIGKKKCIPILISALEALEYRGYDSAGIAYQEKGKINVIKEEGKIENLKKLVDYNNESILGIGHTRWATHGKPNRINAHPHKVGEVTLVHNGIIENYLMIKEKLISEGYEFKSETDSEVACALIDYYYKKEKDELLAIKKASEELKGSYALVILFNEVGNLYGIRKSSPLIIALGNNEYFLASDVPAILKYTNRYILLDDYEIVKLSSNEINIYDKNLKQTEKNINEFIGNMDSASKDGYEHFMLKEINEEDKVFYDTINYYFDGTKKSLEDNFGFLSNFSKIDIVACGSAYHTGVVGKYLIENYANIPVNVSVASEYRYSKNFYDENTLVIVVSQSGETADTLAVLRKAKKDNIKTMAIVNVVGSSIAREADYVIYIKAGFEIAVATTKAYLAQLVIFSLCALYLGLKKKIISDKEFTNIKEDMNKMPTLIKKAINNKKYIEIANKIYKEKAVFFIGRKIDYALCLEASLKLKEISYINSVSYQAGELKHGTISLITEDTYVIAINTDKTIYDKTISNIKEVKARGAKVILVSNADDLDKCCDEFISVNKIHPLFQPILTIIPMQLLAYQVAKNNNCDIDKPRNLAKSVTVE